MNETDLQEDEKQLTDTQEISKVSAGALARTAVLILALINQYLSMKGISTIPFAEKDVSELVSLLFTVAASLLAWWKNNSFTKCARCAEAYRKKLAKEGFLSKKSEQATLDTKEKESGQDG